MLEDVLEIVQIYTHEEVEKTAHEIKLSLEENIKNQLYPGHGYDTGELQSSVRTNIQSITNDTALIVGTYTAKHGDYVLDGVRGRAKVSKIDFLGDGLKETLKHYS